MKVIKKGLRPIVFFLTTLLLLQGCVVYNKTPTTLSKAAKEGIDTKITYRNGTMLKYKYITFEDGLYYGWIRDYDVPGELLKTPLTETEIERILTKNKSASSWATAGIISGSVIAVLILIVISELNSGSGWGGFP